MEKESSNKKIKKVNINKYFRVELFVLSIVIFISMICLIFTTKKYHKYTEKKYPIYSYTNNAKVSYEVFLTPNEIFSQKSLGERNIYITKLIDYIKTNYKYEFNGEKNADISGKYNVTATLQGYIPDDSGNKILWEKKYEIQPATDFKKSDKIMSIDKEIIIDIKSYMDFIKRISEQLKFTFYSKLIIKWNVAPQIKNGSKTANENITTIMEIPLENNYFEIKGDLLQEKKGTIEETKKIIAPDYNKKLIIYSTAAGISIAFIIYLIFFTASLTDLSALSKKRRKIFKEHGNRMVAVVSEINDSYKVTIKVMSIEDLVKIADDIGRPIFYRSSINEEDINVFYLVDEKNVYTLDIREIDLNTPVENNVKNRILDME